MKEESRSERPDIVYKFVKSLMENAEAFWNNLAKQLNILGSPIDFANAL